MNQIRWPHEPFGTPKATHKRWRGQKSKRDKPHRHCGTIMRALLGNDSLRPQQDTWLFVVYALSSGSSSPRPIVVGSYTTIPTLQKDYLKPRFSNYQSHFNWAGAVNKKRGWLHTNIHDRVTLSSPYQATLLGGWTSTEASDRSPGALVLITISGSNNSLLPTWCRSSSDFEEDAWTLLCLTVGVLINTPYHFSFRSHPQ